MKYDYFDNVKEDIKSYIKDNYENLEDIDKDSLYDDLFIEDAVTGNASGSYYCNAWKAEESICHNMDLLKEACDEFGCITDLESAEAMDVTIRCYVLGQCLDKALEELESEN